VAEAASNKLLNKHCQQQQQQKPEETATEAEKWRNCEMVKW